MPARKLPRNLYDFYPTEEWATKGMMSFHEDAFGGFFNRYIEAGRSILPSVLECCSGTHAITQVLKDSQLFSMVFENDLDYNRDADSHVDLEIPLMWQTLPSVDWVISNPPFNAAQAITENAIQHAAIGVAMLLPISFLEPTLDRRGFWKKHPFNHAIFTSRIKFRSDTESTAPSTTVWLIWRKDTTSTEIRVDWLVN